MNTISFHKRRKKTRPRLITLSSQKLEIFRQQPNFSLSPFIKKFSIQQKIHAFLPFIPSFFGLDALIRWKFWIQWLHTWRSYSSEKERNKSILTEIANILTQRKQSTGVWVVCAVKKTSVTVKSCKVSYLTETFSVFGMWKLCCLTLTLVRH